MDEIINQISRVVGNYSIMDELMNQYDKVREAINPPTLNEMDLIDINVQIFINDFNIKTSKVKGDMRIQVIKEKIQFESLFMNQFDTSKFVDVKVAELLFKSKLRFIDYLNNELKKLEQNQQESIEDEPEVAKLEFDTDNKKNYIAYSIIELCQDYHNLKESELLKLIEGNSNVKGLEQSLKNEWNYLNSKKDNPDVYEKSIRYKLDTRKKGKKNDNLFRNYNETKKKIEKYLIETKRVKPKTNQ